MRIATPIFIVLVLLIALKYTKVFDINILAIVGVFMLWFVVIYLGVHLKNKDRNTPRPVYLTE